MNRLAPGTAASPGEFSTQLRLLKVAAGNPSLAMLSRLTGIPRSTLSDALRVQRTRLPALEVVRQIVLACGGNEPEWVSAWESLQAQAVAPGPFAVGGGELPSSHGAFVGRDGEVDHVLAAAKLGGGQAGVVAAIDGMAGVGKTALALTIGHRLRDEYPDGRLFIDLHGHTAGRDPTPADVALAELLTAFGVPGENLPVALEARAALWRSVLAGKRVLLVLDNAAGTAQVRQLVAAGAGCLTLVTSRRRLPALDAGVLVSLSVLPPGKAAGLFAHVVGDARAAAEPEAVDEVVRLCGHLPLAIRIAASRLRHRPAWTVRQLARRLHLAELAVEDRSVAAAFTVSFEHLGPEQQRMFRLAGAAPCVDLSVEAAAALAGVAVAQAERLLEDLVDAHLVLATSPGRYGFHDLIRAYARSLGSPSGLDGLLRHFLDRAAVAAASLNPHWPVVVATAGSMGTAEARAWLDAERVNLLSCFGADPQWTWRMADTLFFYLYQSARIPDLLMSLRHGLAAARSLGDRPAEAGLLNQLGIVRHHLGHYRSALSHCRHAQALWIHLGEPGGVAQTWDNIGLTYELQGRFAEALESFQRALELLDPVADRQLCGIVRHNMGTVLGRMGRHEEELEHQRESLAVAVERGDRWNEARRRTGLAKALTALGRYAEALMHHRRALEIVRELGDRSNEAMMHYFVAVTMHRAGQRREARQLLEIGLDLAMRTGHRYGQARMERLLGVIVRQTDPGRAAIHERRAMELFAVLGVRCESVT